MFRDRRSRRLLPSLVLAVAVACGGDGGDVDAAAEAPRASAPEYSPAATAALEEALAAYEEARVLLAADRTDGLDAAATRLEAAAVRTGAALPDARRTHAEDAAAAARELAAASDLESAREAFAGVSAGLVPLVADHPRLADERHVFSCPMVEGFNRWIQPTEEIENPFMGPSMLACGSEETWRDDEAADTADAHLGIGGLDAHAGHDHAAGVSHYTCPMHPSVESQDPEAACPICGMDLVPVRRGGAGAGVAPASVELDPRRRQALGVRTVRALRRPAVAEVRAVGRVTYDETRLSEVTVKYPGWIGRLEVDTVGERVRRGQTLFTLYSPELLSAQQEYLAALASQRTARVTSAPTRADYLVEAAAKRLRLWDLTPAQIERLAATGEPLEYLPIASPAAGYVVEKHVVAGSAVTPGTTLYRLAGLDRVWVEAEVYEADLPSIEVGQPATVTFPYLPGRRFEGRVDFVYPFLDGDSRAGRVRVTLPNPGLQLKPDMYAEVAFTRGSDDRLIVPTEAVLWAGRRAYVFVDRGAGRLEPQRVEIGERYDDGVEVLSGLAEGEEVVASGNFLVGAESRLQEALDDWR